MATTTDGTTFTGEFVLRTVKKGRLRKVTGNKIQHFLRLARNGDAMKYSDFLSTEFFSSDFYSIIDTAISVGLAKKEGSSYRFDKDFNAKFKAVLAHCGLAALNFLE